MKPDLDIRLNAQELARQLAEKRVSVIDVREAMEFAGGHIEGSVNVPLARLSRTELPQGGWCARAAPTGLGPGHFGDRCGIPALELLAAARSG